MPNEIGTLSEKSLHQALKNHYFQAGDLLETEVEGYVIDILRENGAGPALLIEIQTRNFSAIKKKLRRLLDQGYRIRLVHPVPKEKWILRQDSRGVQVGRRKSPKKGHWLEVFRELVRIPDLLPNPNLLIDVVLTRQEQIWVDDGQGSWRRKGWSIADHRLLDVLETRTLKDRSDYLSSFAPELPRPFTNRSLADALRIRTNLAGKITYTLRKAGWLTHIGKDGRAHLFTDSF